MDYEKTLEKLKHMKVETSAVVPGEVSGAAGNG